MAVGYRQGRGICWGSRHDMGDGLVFGARQMTDHTPPSESVRCIGCGYSSPSIGQWFPHPTDGWWITCPGCKRCTGQLLTQDDAWSEWRRMNTRAQPADDEAVIERVAEATFEVCSSVGAWLIAKDDAKAQHREMARAAVAALRGSA